MVATPPRASPKVAATPGELRAVFVYGRLPGLTREALSELLVKKDARLVRKPEGADTLVVARAALGDCLSAAGTLALPFPCPDPARLCSEGVFRRRLGLMPLDPGGGPYGVDDLARLAGLPVETCRALALFDVVADHGGRFGYVDIATVRQAAALLGRGVPLDAVIRAAWALATRDLRLSQVRLSEAPWGEIVQEIGAGMARLDGQFALVLDEERRDAGATLDQGLACEAGGDLAEAERCYRRAEQADRSNPAIPFNLGNVLSALGRTAEASIAYQRALSRDPAFVEAGFNLARLHEASGDDTRAVAAYRAVLAAHPRYPQALYNGARLLTRLRRFAEALDLWTAFMAAAPDDPDVRHARRGALLCRMELQRQKG